MIKTDINRKISNIWIDSDLNIDKKWYAVKFMNLSEIYYDF